MPFSSAERTKAGVVTGVVPLNPGRTDAPIKILEKANSYELISSQTDVDYRHETAPHPPAAAGFLHLRIRR